jgi:DNA polymerase III subunit epsilon
LTCTKAHQTLVLILEIFDSKREEMQISQPSKPKSKRVPKLSTELLAHYRAVSSQTLTVVGIETSGLSSERDRMIEISVLVGDLESGVQHQQSHLINPELEISYDTIRFTGITQPNLDYSPTAAQILPDYLPLLKNGVITSHNLAIDYKFLQAEYKRLGIDFARSEHDQLCTVQLSRLLLPDLHSRRLPALVRYFGFATDFGNNFGTKSYHRAAADTHTCWLLAQRLLKEIRQEPDQQLLSRIQRQWLNLNQVAEILDCSEAEAQTELVKAGLRSRPVGRTGELLYQRGGVESVAGCQSSVNRFH